MKTKLIETKNFACMAEAVAHYIAQGFASFDVAQDLDCRYMRNADHSEEVRMRKNGLLYVDTSRILIVV